MLVAFPFDPNQLQQLNSLSEKANLSILLDNPDLLPFLRHIENRVPFYIDIDTGYGRTGIPTEDTQILEELIKQSAHNPIALYGDTLSFLPVHSCLTANLMREYLCTDGQLINTLNSRV